MITINEIPDSVLDFVRSLSELRHIISQHRKPKSRFKIIGIIRTEPKPEQKIAPIPEDIEIPMEKVEPIATEISNKNCPQCGRDVKIVDGKIINHRISVDARGYANGPFCSYTELQ